MTLILREQDREIRVGGPQAKFFYGVVADTDNGNASTTPENACVLITVRFHLNCSATGSRPEEERQYHHLSP